MLRRRKGCVFVVDVEKFATSLCTPKSKSNVIGECSVLGDSTVVQDPAADTPF